MKNTNSKDLHNEQIKKRRRRKVYYTVSLTMAAIVVFCTVYALILPAITMEQQQQELCCALDVHQHTDSCYDSDNNLICGEADYVMHTHDNRCFNANGRKVCMLPKIVAHKHSASCYNNKNELICKLPEAEEHNHNELCYDKDGTLICGKLHTIEHVHGTACFRSSRMSGSTNDEAENGISPQSDTANSARASANGDYNPDGSIWWGDLTVTQVGANDIQKNTSYVISGVYDNNLMSDKTTIVDNKSYLGATKRELMQDYKAFDRWYFEKREVDGKYYVYFLRTNEDKSTTPLYLQFSDEYVLGWQSNRVYQTALTEDKAQATAFTMEPTNDNDYPNHIILSTMIEDKKIRVNSNADDPQYGDTYWIGYSGESVGNYLKVCDYSPNGQNTAKRVGTDTSINTVINLFDYWITPNQTDPDSSSNDLHLYDPAYDSALMEGGINNGHDFKFTKGTSSGSNDINYWTQAGQLPRQGIVSSTLENGYPKLSGSYITDGHNPQESLAYLFDPDVTHNGKESFKNVGGLLTLSRDGYYSYNCKKNMAEFDEKSNYIRLYDKPGVTGSGMPGQFFPFNEAPKVMTADRQDSIMNHYFGMTLTTRFAQRHDGYTDERKNTPTSFHFSGDDDVWVFIDDVLVGDVGGIHDAASLDIDFVTGAVTVSVQDGWVDPVTTTIRDCYINAGKEDTETWNGNTFANNTMHTLKFYYLERGNNESNLELRFNLTEVPLTSIEKTDEYGEPVPGTKFAIFAAEGESGDDNDQSDTTYNMLDKKDGTVVDLSDEAGYDVHGNIINSSKQIIANALYVGYTNDEGKLPLLDEDGMPYSIDELEAKFGTKFILREIAAPPGYRMVSVDNDLRIYHGERQSVIVSDNSQMSGCRALTDLHTIATDTIYLRDNKNVSEVSLPPTQYYDPVKSEPNGTIFAVVVKYTGEKDSDGLIPDKITENLLNSTECWTPIYGNDDDGYKVVDMTGKDLYAAAIEAARAKAAMNEDKLKADTEHNYSEKDIADLKYVGITLQHQQNGNMELFMDDLPGHVRYYYNMLPEKKKNLTRYNVIYFWTETTLDNATSDNTSIVNTRPISDKEAGIEYRGFDRTFSALIDVPNLVNDVYVQKVDAKHNLLNGAKFAMYRVKEQPDGQIFYLFDGANVEDDNEDEDYIPLPEGAKPDPATGIITGGGHTFSPAMVDGKRAVDTTRDLGDAHYAGTVKFKKIPKGQYIIKEISAPKGYKINTTDIMFLVTDYKVLANAGTEEDGVIVGRGPGYLVSPVHPLASEGDINNTLTWVHAQMQITAPSTSFADAGNDSTLIGYLTKQNSSEVTKDSSQAFKTYLHYTNGNAGTAFNYTPDLDRYEDKNPANKRRIFHTSGWDKYELWQDYEYGEPIAAAKGADYYDWSKNEITYLFSRSTYIRVIDENKDVALKPEKVDASDKNIKLSGAQFRLYRINSNNEKEYYVKEKTVQGTTDSGEKTYVETVSWSTDSSKAFVVTTGNDGLSSTPDQTDPNDTNTVPTPNFTGLYDGTYYLEEIKPPNGYAQPPVPVKLTVALSEMTCDPSSGCVFNSDVNKEVYTLTVPNSTGYELPQTGGSGTFMYTVGGILLVAVSLVFGYRRKRRSERRVN